MLPMLECDDARDNEASLHAWMNKASTQFASILRERLVSKPWLDSSTKEIMVKQPRVIAKTSEVKHLSPIKENGTDEEVEEEDLINDRFVEMDLDSDVESVSNADKGVLDLEDIGQAMMTSQATTSSGNEMVTNLQRKALTKEGYKIIGSHSAVKLCRWTKNQLRGRGGCYKHTFYGITSYQCMEATPSLACANKCVFCWRHHKNPVGTEWRWKEDDPR